MIKDSKTVAVTMVTEETVPSAKVCSLVLRLGITPPGKESKEERSNSHVFYRGGKTTTTTATTTTTTTIKTTLDYHTNSLFSYQCGSKQIEHSTNKGVCFLGRILKLKIDRGFSFSCIKVLLLLIFVEVETSRRQIWSTDDIN